MKITLRKLVENAETLGAINHKQGLSRKMSYAIAKNTKKIENELEIYNCERQKLIDKYCVKDDEGKNLMISDNQLKIADEHLEEWNRDLQELLNIEVEIDIHKFNIDDFYNSNCDLTPAELIAIDYMIEE